MTTFCVVWTVVTFPCFAMLSLWICKCVRVGRRLEQEYLRRDREWRMEEQRRSARKMFSNVAGSERLKQMGLR